MHQKVRSLVRIRVVNVLEVLFGRVLCDPFDDRRIAAIRELVSGSFAVSQERFLERLWDLVPLVLQKLALKLSVGQSSRALLKLLFRSFLSAGAGEPHVVELIGAGGDGAANDSTSGATGGKTGQGTL